MKKMCVFTHVFNDPYLDTWLGYYSRHFKDIYVINHGGTDTSINEAKKKYTFTEIKDDRGEIRNITMNENCIESIARLQQRNFLREYEWVLYAHADEIVIPDPQKYSGIENYIDKLSKDFVFCNGRTVLQIDEPDLDFSKPILSQITHTFFSNWKKIVIETLSPY